MNKPMHNLLFSMLFMIATLPIAQKGYADTGVTYGTVSTSGDATTDDAMQAVKKYLYNLGGNLGYNLETDVTSTLPNVSLINPPTVSTLETLAQTAFYALFGAMPSGANFLFVATTTSSAYTALNDLANATFPSYGSPSSSSSSVTASTLIDQVSQKNYQADPVSQAVLNILGTPNYTWCMDSTSSATIDKYTSCAYLTETRVMTNAVITNNAYPVTPFCDPNDNTSCPPELLSTLNSDSLTAPLIYSTTAGGSTSGLIGSNQMEQAADFIRYATGAADPFPTISQSDYNTLLQAAIPPSSSTTLTTSQLSAQASLATYLADVRTYAAKSSVSISNLYWILSKRLPQKPLGSSQSSTSQAYTEMTMATRRLYDPSNTSTPQWIDSINSASPATVQKEMAILLSEINYQLYLSRQQDERLLLTNSLLLLQLLRQNPPVANVPTSGTSTS